MGISLTTEDKAALAQLAAHAESRPVTQEEWERVSELDLHLASMENTRKLSSGIKVTYVITQHPNGYFRHMVHTTDWLMNFDEDIQMIADELGFAWPYEERLTFAPTNRSCVHVMEYYGDELDEI